MAIRLPGTPQTWLDTAVFKAEEEQYAFELAEARKSGRYSFRVAARLIAEAAGPTVSYEKIEDRLKLDARDRSLPVYTLGHTLRWDGENPFVATLEILWNDLNRWLQENEPRIYEATPFRAPEQNDAPANAGNAAPLEVGTADTATEHEEPKQENGEPKLKQGWNSRGAVEKWVAWQAQDKVKEGDKVSDLAENIWLITEKWGYESARGKMTVASITKMIPAGLTGGRGKNKGQSKNMRNLDFGGSKSKKEPPK